MGSNIEIEIDYKKMIELVEARPPLYNFMLTEHHNREVVDHFWEEVAQELNLNVSECRSKWNILRSSYIRYLRRTKKRQQHSNTKKWHLADNMSFLRQFIDYHRLLPKDLRDNAIIPQDLRDNAIIPQESCYIPVCTPPVLRSQPKRKITTKSNVAVATTSKDEIIIDEKEIEFCPPSSSCSITSTTPSTTVSSMKFFESLVPDVEKLSGRGQRKFKENVLALLNCLLDEQEAEQQLDLTFPRGNNPPHHSKPISFITTNFAEN